MFKLWQKLVKGFACINNIFYNDNFPVIKIHIKANSCYHFTRRFHAFIRCQFYKTYFSFKSNIFKKICSKNESSIKYGDKQRLFSLIIPVNFCSYSWLPVPQFPVKLCKK